MKHSRSQTWSAQRTIKQKFALPANSSADSWVLWQQQYEAVFPISGKVVAAELHFRQTSNDNVDMTDLKKVEKELSSLSLWCAEGRSHIVSEGWVCLVLALVLAAALVCFAPRYCVRLLRNLPKDARAPLLQA